MAAEAAAACTSSVLLGWALPLAASVLLPFVAPSCSYLLSGGNPALALGVGQPLAAGVVLTVTVLLDGWPVVPPPINMCCVNVPWFMEWCERVFVWW